MTEVIMVDRSSAFDPSEMQAEASPSKKPQISKQHAKERSLSTVCSSRFLFQFNSLSLPSITRSGKLFSRSDKRKVDGFLLVFDGLGDHVVTDRSEALSLP
jgi:hypothetical protein